MCHLTAFEAGVPVAAPLLPEITKSQSTCGSEFLVFAMEYIEQDSIDNPEDFFQFCSSLIDTVMTLHNKAELLHCDLKPGNIRWNKGVVRLLDFGHAQSRINTTWAPGTQGFEATEILNKMPCSAKTDAFSVGRIFLTLVEEVENSLQQEPNELERIYNILREIGENLAHSDLESRLSLTGA